MPLNLRTIRQIATAVAHEADPDLEVLGTTRAEGSTDFVEVIFGYGDEDRRDTPVIVMVKRELDRAELQRALAKRLRARLKATAR